MRMCIVGGDFATLSGQPRDYLARLNANGTLDNGFNPGADGDVYSLVMQADGKILVGGNFGMLGGQPRDYLARLNTDGSLDHGFNPGADGDVFTMAVQTDGRILVGGAFTTLGGQPCDYVGRLNGDGTLDATFHPGANWEVYSLTIQADGKILAGGSFLTLAGQPRVRIGRLNNTGSATQRLSWDGSAISWLRGGTGPEVWSTTFEVSTNCGDGWLSLGTGARRSGGWQLTGVNLPCNASVRARGFVDSGGISDWFVESLLSPIILTDDRSLGVVPNHFGFQVRALWGWKVLVEASSDLVHWEALVTNSVNADNLFYFSEDPGWRARFYRAIRLCP